MIPEPMSTPAAGWSYLNRTRIVPTERKPDRFGWMQDFDYMSCMALFADGFSNWKELCSAANEELNGVPDLLGGATELSHGGCVVRFLARSASGYDAGE